MSPRRVIAARGLKVTETPPEYPDKNWRAELDDECGRFAYGPDREEVVGRLARRVVNDVAYVPDPIISPELANFAAWFAIGLELGLSFCLLAWSLR